MHIEIKIYIQIYSRSLSREKWLAAFLQKCDWFTWGRGVELMTSVQWCSWFLYGSFSRTSRRLWPTPSERRKRMPRHPCTRRTPPREMHIQTPPSLCCWLHTQERGDTACLQRPHMMRKLSEKKHGPTECGKSWMNLDAKTFWKSLHCVLSMECYCSGLLL